MNDVPMTILACIVSFLMGGFVFANFYANAISKDCAAFGQMRIGEAVYECRRK